MSRFAETLMIICNGEVRQLFDGREGQPSLQEYERRIYAKTASLIALSAEAGPILARADEEIVGSLRLYGERLGLAFQIVDDVLDFVADEETLGKPVGSDLRQGLITLPTLLFLQRDSDNPALRRVLAGTRSQEVVEDAVQAIATSPIIDRAMEMARQYADQAQAALVKAPDNPHRSALLDLADFAVNRRF
jgi:geranylgeranyl pyrophosphate synthase